MHRLTLVWVKSIVAKNVEILAFCGHCVLHVRRLSKYSNFITGDNFLILKLIIHVVLAFSLDLNLFDVLSDLLSQKLSKLRSYSMFCGEFCSQIIRVISLID